MQGVARAQAGDEELRLSNAPYGGAIDKLPLLQWTTGQLLPQGPCDDLVCFSLR